MSKEYNTLKKKFTPEELADSFVFPAQLTKKQKAEAQDELRNVLKQRRQDISPEYQLKARLLQLHFQLATQ